MTHLESTGQIIARPVHEVFAFVEDFRNFGHLMPAQVANYKAEYNHCSFDISSMGHVSLEITERIANKSVKASSTGKTPIKFDLLVNLDSTDQHHCRAVVHLNADLSPMLAMLAKSPLNNFINMMAGKLKEVMETRS